MTNIEKLKAFFQAENDRDWAQYQSFLSDDVIWALHGSKTDIIKGKKAYLSKIKSAYKDSELSFTYLSIDSNTSQSRIVTILENDYGERSCDIFEFENELIAREWEFLL